ncbi:hypothetical protein EXIGLDRAFT_215269 [Exidia glandulosa HHB12029]|uniref:Uncharacterized protein n=1 Tax=Exidia glandulosa HHB12029 TaxID=1314781 RepID=A0A165MU47_EXIGL|nr:hypothetical protein EXIGLDRAFT_215269 [Exidia glandulosa HHB12029]
MGVSRYRPSPETIGSVGAHRKTHARVPEHLYTRRAHTSPAHIDSRLVSNAFPLLRVRGRWKTSCQTRYGCARRAIYMRLQSRALHWRCHDSVKSLRRCHNLLYGSASRRNPSNDARQLPELRITLCLSDGSSGTLRLMLWRRSSFSNSCRNPCTTSSARFYYVCRPWCVRLLPLGPSAGI